MDRYLSHFKPLKVTKTFHHTEIVNNKIHENSLSLGCPFHSSFANENKDKTKSIKPDCGKFYQGMNFNLRKVVLQLRFYQQFAKMMLRIICLNF